MLKAILPVFVLAVSCAAHGTSTFYGVLHNDSKEMRATLETSSGLYVLDYRGADLYHVGERYDREPASVTGTVRHLSNYRFPVIQVEQITFSPNGTRAVTYNVRLPRYQYYTRYYHSRPEYRSDFSRDYNVGYHDTDSDGYRDRYDGSYNPYPQHYVSDFRYSDRDRDVIRRYRRND
ncbi:MAG TPA: hypothetical protein VEK08_04415 [Planctomycetota bacterium]|nr:hypothetical protein [Planctomycetota bacterium]